MSILDIFKSQPAAPQPAPPQPTPPGNVPTPTGPVTEANPGTAPNGTVPAGTEPPKDDSPLADYADLWKIEENKGGEPTPPAELKAEDVQRVVDQANFADNLPPEVLAAISEGGEGAQQAFASAMNSVAKNVLVQATLVGNKLTEKAVTEAIENERSKLPDLLRKHSIQDHSKDSNPIFSHPAVQPIMETTQAQLAAKFPDATPAQITEMTQEYILAMGQAFAPKTPESGETSSNDTDWESFLTK